MIVLLSLIAAEKILALTNIGFAEKWKILFQETSPFPQKRQKARTQKMVLINQPIMRQGHFTRNSKLRL